LDSATQESTQQIETDVAGAGHEHSVVTSDCAKDTGDVCSVDSLGQQWRARRRRLKNDQRSGRDPHVEEVDRVGQSGLYWEHVAALHLIDVPCA